MEERIISNIIKNNIMCKNNNEQLRVIFYYKNQKTSNLVIRNNVPCVSGDLGRSCVIYKYTCSDPLCQKEYIGVTRTG